MIARRRVFESVFPPAPEKIQPTPQATPLIGAGSFGATFGHSAQDIDTGFTNADRAWSIILEYLSLPDESIILENRSYQPKSASQEIRQAVRYVDNVSTNDPTSRRNLHQWYIQEFSQHYKKYEFPGLLRLSIEGIPLDSLLGLLGKIKDFYLQPWTQLYQTIRGYQDLPHVQQMRKAFHALISATLSRTSFYKQFKQHLSQSVKNNLEAMQRAADSSDGPFESPRALGQHAEVDAELKQLLAIVADIGLGGAAAQQILAEVFSEHIPVYIRQMYGTKWETPSSAPEGISDWIEHAWATLAMQSVRVLEQAGSGTDIRAGITSPNEAQSQTGFFPEDMLSWKERGKNELMLLRSKQLFDLIVSWPESQGAIEDLGTCIETTQARATLSIIFQRDLNRRLLQPGASTSQILDFYVRLIGAFAVLDPGGLIFDRVARPIRRYLRERDDTVKLIVAGFLADPDDEENPDLLAVLATHLAEATQAQDVENTFGLDYNDMNWMPDSVDAEPEYKKNKSSDVIGNLISLWETRDVFVKEFQNILGERLLQTRNDYDAETRLLELLKIRFGEASLQPCEVMLRDVSDSTRIDAWVRREQGPEIDISARILSRLFWPALHEESFILPTPIAKLQSTYAAGFEKYKNSRKLAWLDALGEVTVELELEDRKVVEEVKTPQATIIYAFQGTGPVSKTAEQLAEELEMDEDLVNNSLLFWVGKLVLIKSASGSYSVLERLPNSVKKETQTGVAGATSSIAAAAAMASATAAAAPVSALRSNEDIAEEKMQIYWQFILGMLTNQGAMPLPRIVMMLKIAMAGGFPYSNDDLKNFLGRRVDDGTLELVGGSYRLLKPAL